MNKDNIILLVEDSPSDAILTTHTLKLANVVNEIVVAKDGAEALDYLFGTLEQASCIEKNRRDSGLDKLGLRRSINYLALRPNKLLAE